MLPVEAELDGHHRPLLAGSVGSVPGDPGDLGVREDRGVVLRRLLGLAVEPQAGNLLRHRSVPSVTSTVEKKDGGASGNSSVRNRTCRSRPR